MREAQKDTQRALAAAKAIIDGRDVVADQSAIMVTLEHLVSTVSMATTGGNHRIAAGMLTEGLAPGVEERLAFAAPKSN